MASCKNPECGILVHQLPNSMVGKAAHFFSEKLVTNDVFELGMRVYFAEKDTAQDYVRSKMVELDGAYYNAYPLVTCLTIYGILDSVSRADIRAAFEKEGLPVLGLHPISKTHDYRVVLDVPEVSANFHLQAIPSRAGQSFPVAFFCRLCRGEGHKQYQCSRHVRVVRRAAAPPGGGETETPGLVEGSNQGSSNTATPRENSSNANEVPDSAPENVAPTTSGAPAKAEGNQAVKEEKMGNEETPAKERKRKQKADFPCNDIINIILKISDGVLTPGDMHSFLSHVYGKKKAEDIARKFTADIPALVGQIRKIIDCYFKQDKLSAAASRDIKILESLCERLEKQYAPQENNTP